MATTDCEKGKEDGEGERKNREKKNRAFFKWRRNLGTRVARCFSVRRNR